MVTRGGGVRVGGATRAGGCEGGVVTLGGVVRVGGATRAGGVVVPGGVVVLGGVVRAGGVTGVASRRSDGAVRLRCTGTRGRSPGWARAGAGGGGEATPRGIRTGGRYTLTSPVRRAETRRGSPTILMRAGARRRPITASTRRGSIERLTMNRLTVT